MKKLFAKRKEPERAPEPVQLPDWHGFEHPFRHLLSHRIQLQAMEHPRTVSAGSSQDLLRYFDIGPSDHRAADVCALQLHQRKTKLVGGGEKQGRH